VPTTEHLLKLQLGKPLEDESLVQAVITAARDFRFFHWHLRFGEVMDQGGFDCVLGNPPWERIKLQEKEFFAARSEAIATAPNKAARERLIKALSAEEASETERALVKDFELTKREAEGSGEFIRSSGRFALTAVGDLNTYALFADHFLQLTIANGQSGMIVPTGIATDTSTRLFFSHISRSCLLQSLVSFENESLIFRGVHHAYKFCLLVLRGEPRLDSTPDFVFYVRDARQLEDRNRHFSLDHNEVCLLNPSTQTCPAFRSKQDADLAKTVYRRTPLFKSDTPEAEDSGWDPYYIRLIDLGDHAENLEMSHFTTKITSEHIGVYESKLFNLYDPFYASFSASDASEIQRGLPSKIPYEQKILTNQDTLFRYHADPSLARSLLDKYSIKKGDYFLVWRDVARNVDERTCIPCIIPGHYLSTRTSPGIGIGISRPECQLILLGNLSSLVLDYFARQKVVGAHLNWGLLKQLPVIPFGKYSSSEIDFLLDRLVNLICFNDGYLGLAKSVDRPMCDQFNLDQRQIDACYAHLYGLTRDELRYILDPADLMGPDYPSETFRVLKNNEQRQFGEYRTQRLVLEAWDRLFG
jgi:hypothetical protein